MFSTTSFQTIATLLPPESVKTPELRAFRGLAGSVFTQPFSHQPSHYVTPWA